MIFQKQIANVTADFLPKLSDKKIIFIAKVLESLAPTMHAGAIKGIREAVESRHPSLYLLKRIFNVNPNYRRHIMQWIFDTITGKMQKWEEYSKKEGFTVPTTILISPSMRCNLSCKGCYAANYKQDEDMSFETFDKIVKEGKKLGIFFFTFLGGEPFVWPHIFKICAKHNDCMFQVYTNGTLINERTVKSMLKLGNLIPVLSIEGFEKETDARRGKNVYKRVHYSMSLLKQHRVPFGYSVCVSKRNADIVMSERFVDMMIQKGALIGWYFLYMPVGRLPSVSEMPSPLQRLKLLRLGRVIRATKPLFIIDFWNDAPYVGGCIAGKHYVHITHKGDVEPCIFTHVAVDNIKNKSLKQILQSPFFKELRGKQPFNENLFRPCMWIDNPEVSRELFEKFKLYPTHPGADFIIKNKQARKKIDKYSQEVADLYADEWQNFKKHMNGTVKKC
jgi:MoaA/NifB/PqqE/SkfB family radical SAM enzyme